MSEQGYSPDGQERQAQWDADRATEAAPLPFSYRSHYASDTERQVDLGAAERSNIARAAGELNMTSDEYMAKRKELGRSPTARDAR